MVADSLYHTKSILRNPFCGKVVSISVAAAQSNALLDVCYNDKSSIEDNQQKQDQ
jgi:hypothetical protein